MLSTSGDKVARGTVTEQWGAQWGDDASFKSFGKGWFGDATAQLKLDNVTEFSADYGQLPDLNATNPNHDILFTWNGTTSGVRVRFFEIFFNFHFA